MKRFPITLTAIIAVLGAMVSTAQAELKVASVNMTELNVMFYKRVEAEATLEKQKKEIEEEIKTRAEALRSLQAEAEKINKQLDPTLSDAAGKTLRSKLQSLKNQYDAKAEEVKTFVQRREVAFQAVLAKELQLLAKELHETVAAVAEEGHYDLVIDSSAVGRARVFPYVKPSMDISAEVLKRLNAGAPADFNAQAELERARNAAAAPAVPTEEEAK